MKRRVYYIPHFLDSVGELATAWVKFHHKDLLLHQGWKRLTLSERGAWIQLFLLAGACRQRGELRNGGFIYTDKMLAKELNTRLSCWLRVKKRLMSPKIRLLRSKVCKLSDNLQKTGSPNGVPTGFPGKNLPIDSDKKDRKNRKRDERFFFTEGTKVKAKTSRHHPIKKGEIGVAYGYLVRFKTWAIHQEVVRENPYEWEVMDGK